MIMARKKITYEEIVNKYDSDYDDYYNGKSIVDIAEEYGVSRQTIYKYLKIVAEHYSNSLNQKRGRKPKDISKTIVRLYTKDYELWKQGKASIKAIAERYDKSRTTIYKYFRILENLKINN